MSTRRSVFALCLLTLCLYAFSAAAAADPAAAINGVWVVDVKASSAELKKNGATDSDLGEFLKVAPTLEVTYDLAAKKFIGKAMNEDPHVADIESVETINATTIRVSGEKIDDTLVLLPNGRILVKDVGIVLKRK